MGKATRWVEWVRGQEEEMAVDPHYHALRASKKIVENDCTIR